MTQNGSVRPATRQDVPTLLSMMKATAAEQNVLEAVTATEADLLHTLDFPDPSPPATSTSTSTSGGTTPTRGKAIVVETPEGQIAGMAIYFTTYIAWSAKNGISLEDLYVDPAYRSRGYARLLVRELAGKAEELGSGSGARLEWLCYKWNERALRFYRGLGAKEMGGIELLRIDGDELQRFAGEGRDEGGDAGV